MIFSSACGRWFLVNAIPGAGVTIRRGSSSFLVGLGCSNLSPILARALWWGNHHSLCVPEIAQLVIRFAAGLPQLVVQGSEFGLATVSCERLQTNNTNST